MEYLLELLPHVVSVLVGFAVLRFARRQPLPAAVLLAGLSALGLALVWHAADLGVDDQRAMGRIVGESTAAQVCFTAGAVLLVLAVPAFYLVGMAAVRPVKKGHDGWLVGPYWLACLAFSMVLTTWLTGMVE